MARGPGFGAKRNVPSHISPAVAAHRAVAGCLTSGPQVLLRRGAGGADGLEQRDRPRPQPPVPLEVDPYRESRLSGGVGFDDATQRYRYTVNETASALPKAGDRYPVQVGVWLGH